MGEEVDGKVVSKAFKQIDTDDSGTLDFTEVLTVRLTYLHSLFPIILVLTNTPGNFVKALTEMIPKFTDFLEEGF